MQQKMSPSGFPASKLCLQGTDISVCFFFSHILLLHQGDVKAPKRCSIIYWLKRSILFFTKHCRIGRIESWLFLWMELKEVFESTNINSAPVRCKVLFWEFENPKWFSCLYFPSGLHHLIEVGGLLHIKGITRQKGHCEKVNRVLWENQEGSESCASDGDWVQRETP